MTVEDLREYGMERMDATAIRGFLTSQHQGVLGLPGEDDAPLLRPLSYWFDGEETLYFVYVVGDGARKVDHSDRARRASFLVYRADTPFNWRSVLVRGPIEEVPADERAAVVERAELRWRPDVFERAGEDETTTVYRLRVEDQVGIEHGGLPSGWEER